mgnify:CR=1 FL=1
MDIAPTRPGELEEVTAFLANAFGVTAASPFLDRRLMSWKYFQPRPGFPGSRSFLARRDGKIAAHVGLWPVAWTSVSGSPVTGQHLIDWGASKEVSGAGTALYRDILSSAGTAVVIGGATIARRLLPGLGFRRAGKLDLYARVVRPWRQLRARPARGWKDAARFARNTVWSLSPLLARKPDLTALPASEAPADVEELISQRTASGGVLPVRSRELFAYIEACPGADCRTFVLRRSGSPTGYFVLARAGPQTRIADLWVSWTHPEEWASAVALATQTAADDLRVAEVVAPDARGVLREALWANGYRLRAEKPLYFHDPDGRLGPPEAVSVTLLESDGFFLCDPTHPFLT